MARGQFWSLLPGVLPHQPPLWPPPRSFECPCWDSPPQSTWLSDLVSLLPHQRKAQITCTAIFIVWGVLVHLVIPPFVFMVTEEWNYIQGLYYSFITISTIGFGDFVAGECCLCLPPSLSASPVSMQLTFMGLCVRAASPTPGGPPYLPAARGKQGSESSQGMPASLSLAPSSPRSAFSI